MENFWRLRPGWRVFRREDGLHFCTDVRRILVRGESAALDLIESEIGRDEFSVHVLGKDASRLLERLSQEGIVEVVTFGETASVSLDPHLAYVERLGIDPETARSRLDAARVLLIGVGGTGSVVLQHLVGAGIREFVLLDHDIVEEKNLGRQFVHSLGSVGVSKTRSGAKYVEDHGPGTHVRPIDMVIRTSADVLRVVTDNSPVTVAAICIDEPPEAAFTNCATSLWKAAVPFVHGGLMTQSGFWGPLFSLHHGSPDPAAFGATNKAAPRRHEACFGPYNTVVGAHMAADLIHHIIGAHHLVDYRRRTFQDWNANRQLKLGVPGRRWADAAPGQPERRKA